MRLMMTSHSELIRSAEHIICPTCKEKSTRVGAQDYCDVYVCDNEHLTRIRVGAKRKIWVDDEF